MRAEAVERRLASLRDLSRKGKRLNGLHRLLAHPLIWEQAYEAIAPNQGALTPGVDPDNTLDGFSLERMQGIIDKVKDGTYRFRPVRRHYIPKPNGKLRPLGIPNADDKLVQAAVKLVLEHIYEPVFSSRSHGFRPRRSCHTALEKIQKVWNGVVWLVDVDIVGFFDNIDHGILLNLLRKRVDDEDFLKLIEGMLKAGYMEDWTWHETYSGTPQGGVISPLLANVYLHELDEFMKGLAATFERGHQRRPNPEYRSLFERTRSLRQRISQLAPDSPQAMKDQMIEAYREARTAMQQLPSRDMYDPDYRRLQYIRYADDFLIGVIGSKQEARDVMEEVRRFLATELKLAVSDEKSGIANAADGATFLGYTVRTHNSERRTKRRLEGASVTVSRRPPSKKMQLHLPREKLAAFVERKRLGNYHATTGTMRPEFENNSDLEIIVAYNAVIRGLAEYYKLGTGWRGEISPVCKVWWFSLMKTLANKHKCSIRTVCRKLLSRHNGERGIWTETGKGRKFVAIFRTMQIVDKKRVKPESLDKVVSDRWTLARTDMVDRLRAKQCEVCSATDVPLEIHHVRRLADTSSLSLGARLMTARRRKRTALCHDCHVALHRGTLEQRLDHLKANVGAG